MMLRVITFDLFWIVSRIVREPVRYCGRKLTPAIVKIFEAGWAKGVPDPYAFDPNANDPYDIPD
jgi:hypothetical protein